RYSAGADRQDGARGLCAIPDRDGAARRASGESQWLLIERLSRRHCGVEEKADHGRGDPAILRKAAARHRKKQRLEEARDPAGPPGTDWPADPGGNCAAAGTADDAAAVSAQNRTAWAIRAAAEYSLGNG